MAGRHALVTLPQLAHHSPLVLFSEGHQSMSKDTWLVYSSTWPIRKIESQLQLWFAQAVVIWWIQSQQPLWGDRQDVFQSQKGQVKLQCPQDNWKQWILHFVINIQQLNQHMCAEQQLKVHLSFVDGSQKCLLPQEVPPLLPHCYRLLSVI